MQQAIGRALQFSTAVLSVEVLRVVQSGLEPKGIVGMCSMERPKTVSFVAVLGVQVFTTPMDMLQLPFFSKGSNFPDGAILSIQCIAPQAVPWRIHREMLGVLYVCGLYRGASVKTKCKRWNFICWVESSKRCQHSAIGSGNCPKTCPLSRASISVSEHNLVVQCFRNLRFSIGIGVNDGISSLEHSCDNSSTWLSTHVEG